VLTIDPEVVFYRDGGVNHTDHREAGLAAVDAVYPAARNAMAFPALARAGLAPHKVRRLYLFWPNDPNAWVDVSATVGRKVDALLAHASQLRDVERVRGWIESSTREEGAEIGATAGEAFRVIVIDEDEDGDEAEGPG
jgi:LmbE family N-acetylglucosaminyl deacetylase